MRLVFHNPQSEVHFGIPLVNYLTKAPSFRKYGYLLDYYIRREKDIAFYLDKYSSSFPHSIGRFIPVKLEFIFWCLINGLDPRRFDVITDVRNLRTEDVLFSFAYKNLDGYNNEISFLNDTKALKVFHLTHFIMRTTRVAEISQQVGIDLFLAENNLKHNSPFFNKYFSSYTRSFYTLPFVFQKRFVNKAKYSQRKNKCLATGTLIQIDEMVNNGHVFKEFIDFYKTGTVHPLRREILINKGNIEDQIDSYIYNIWEKKRKDTESATNLFSKLYSKLFNAFILSKRDYFKFNIVDKYNEYKMFVSPEEINDMPGVGFVEGMACGCAYFGINSPMYTDLGMMPGTHYIAHDGDLGDLLEKIFFYQAHEDSLEKIAAEGYKYVTSNLNQERVAEVFWKHLEKLSAIHTVNSQE